MGPGFVRILDERTLLIPERPGNRIADTLTNLLADPRVALLFLIPGVGDTFRVNGRAAITDDAELLAPSTVEGKAPKLGLLVSIEEAYTHCPKAMIRSEIWNPERHIDRERAAELRRDPAVAEHARFRRRAVRPRARGAVRAARGVVLAPGPSG